MLCRLAQILEGTLDLDGLLELAESAGEYEETDCAEAGKSMLKGQEKVRIGFARDEAFCFAYEDNLELLKELGAELIPFSPLRDGRLPENLDGLLLYGGYPELFGRRLEKNAALREEIREKLGQGMPVMAECGGFMYLHDTFEDGEGNPCNGVGAIHGRAYKTPKLSRFGYISASKKEGTVFGEEIGACPAHEFHYFDSTNCGTDFYAQKPESSRGWECMHSTDTMLAGFPHFYYYGNTKLAEAFLNACRKF